MNCKAWAGREVMFDGLSIDRPFQFKIKYSEIVFLLDTPYTPICSYTQKEFYLDTFEMPVKYIVLYAREY
jgi:hypothetical protein